MAATSSEADVAATTLEARSGHHHHHHHHHKKKERRSRSLAELPQVLPDSHFSPATSCQPSPATRQLVHRRAPGGGFFADAPTWQVDAGTAAVLPSMHRSMSRLLWGNHFPEYSHFPEVSEMKASLVDHRRGHVRCKEYLNPKNEHTEYANEAFKVGNKQMMRTSKGVPKLDK
mmetsp:Transcript_70184/g.177983  ORF Transcript_70184/g.177983 Transcript_70184/m.177983 type:complete len:173 (-) Transcript_70184:66-584(-)